MRIEVAVISLLTAYDRRKSLTDQLGFCEGFEWSFFDALQDGSVVPGLEVSPEAQIREYGRPLTAGEVGCFKSHFTVLSEFLQASTSEWLHVLEDDVWFDPNFSLLEVVDFAEQRDLAYIRLFAKAYKSADIVGSLSNFRQVIRFRTDPYGAQCYLINKKGCRSLLANIKAITVPFDDELGRFWQHGLDAYCVFPFPAIERSVPSALTSGRDASSAARVHLTPARLLGRISSKARKAVYNATYKSRMRMRAKQAS